MIEWLKGLWRSLWCWRCPDCQGEMYIHEDQNGDELIRCEDCEMEIW